MATFGIQKPAGDIKGDLSKLRFRCSCNRIGKKQSMTSAACAGWFGGFVNDYANWQFNLVDFNCHIICYMMGNAFQVQMALTPFFLARHIFCTG